MQRDEYSPNDSDRRLFADRLLRNIEWRTPPSETLANYSLAELSQLEETLEGAAQRIARQLARAEPENQSAWAFLQEYYERLALWRLAICRRAISLQMQRQKLRSARFLPARKRFRDDKKNKGRN